MHEATSIRAAWIISCAGSQEAPSAESTRSRDRSPPIELPPSLRLAWPCFYVDNIGSAATALKIRPTEAGANVMLLAPFDEVVFQRTWEDGGLTLVAPSQAAVDLLTSPGRALSEAGAILERLAGNPT